MEGVDSIDGNSLISTELEDMMMMGINKCRALNEPLRNSASHPPVVNRGYVISMVGLHRQHVIFISRKNGNQTRKFLGLMQERWESFGIRGRWKNETRWRLTII